VLVAVAPFAAIVPRDGAYRELRMDDDGAASYPLARS
jgi:hypothetical protein